MKSSKSAEKAKYLFFQMHPDCNSQEKRKVVGEILELIDMYMYFEVKRKTGSQKNQKQLLKNNNHGSRNRHRLHLVKRKR